MNRIGFILILLIYLSFPVYSSQDFIAKNTVKKGQKIVFAYHIPDEDVSNGENSAAEEKNIQSNDNVTDDVTADTSLDIKLTEDEEWEIPPVVDYDSVDLAEYDIDDMYNDVLTGGVVYNEDEVISLEKVEPHTGNFAIKQPAKINEKKFVGLNALNSSLYHDIKYSRLNSMPEYSITPISASDTHTLGGFSAGASYGQWISSGELEQASGLFTGYRYKNFYIQTAYIKTVNSTNNDYSNNFYLSPEYQINQYLKLKQRFSTDVDSRKKRLEVSVAWNPFGLKDPDRLAIELGAVQVLSEDNGFLKNQFKFSTRFKF